MRMKIMVKDKVTFNKCTRTEAVTGIVETIVNKGLPNEYYLIKMSDGELTKASPQDILSSILVLRSNKSSKPKVKKNCGCKK